MTERYRILGICDVKDKRHGVDDCVFFADEHAFLSDRVPDKDELIAYAKKRGYYPSGKRGAAEGLCSPIYYAIRSEDTPA